MNDSTIADALCTLLEQTLAAARKHESGIVAGQDIEHLHQYRVNLRKARAGLSLLKPAFSNKQTRYFKQTFSALMCHTGKLRDLDVALAQKQSFITMLDSDDAESLSGLFDYLQTRRDNEFERVKAHLQSEQYQHCVARLAVKIERRRHGENHSEVLDVFKPKLIQNQFDKIARRAHKALSTRCTNQLHQLRIEVKKLRYVLVFLDKALSKSIDKVLFKDLKQQQDVLGRWHDLVVQNDLLGQVRPCLADADQAVLDKLTVAVRSQLQLHEFAAIETCDGFVAYRSVQK